MRELLVEKGVLTPEEIAEHIDGIDSRAGGVHGTRVVARAWVDPAFKQRLLDDCRSALLELDIDIGELADFVAIENTPDVHNVVVCTLCSCYPKTLLGIPPAWYKSLAYRSRTVREPRAVLKEFGTRLNYGDGLGNKREYEAGVMMNFGNWMLFPRYLYRENLVDANPSLPPEISDDELFPGAGPRNRDDDPFAVLDNREAKAYELFLTYDPTGATGFYQWDNDWREDAKFAFNIGGNYTELPTFTDSYQFFFEPTGGNPAFGVGLPPEDTWELSSRIVYNPSRNVRSIFRLRHAFLQSTGDPEGGTRKFWEFNAKFVVGGRHIIDGYFKKDAWGAYDFQRQFNITFPEQFKLDYSILLDQKKSETTSSKIGIRGLYRTSDENSPVDEFLLGQNKYRYQVVFYYVFNFGGTNPPRTIN